MDFEVERSSRVCARCGRSLAEGEEFYSALVREGARIRRLDYAPEAWTGAPEGALGWWKSRVPTRESRKARLAPSEVLLELFEELERTEDRRDMRYVLALLMVRRRILKLEETLVAEPDACAGSPSGETLVLYCPRNETTYQVPVVVPDEARAIVIQDELAGWLFAGGAEQKPNSEPMLNSEPKPGTEPKPPE